ncbi:hypothetical protein V8E55_011213 [Tylopilus felleus]
MATPSNPDPSNKCNVGQVKLMKGEQRSKRPLTVHAKTPRDQPDDVKIAHIRSLLAILRLDTIQTIEQITPRQFETICRTFQGERERASFNAKFLYIEEEEKLIVMNPSSAHEGFLVSLLRTVLDFLGTLGHDKHMFNFVVATNMGLYYIDRNNIKRETKPDFQVLIQNIHSGILTPKWIGEVCFTASPIDTRDHLRYVLAHQPDVDLAFMITIEEDPKWVSPGSDNETLHQLRSQPLLTCAQFISNVGDDLGSVVKAGFAWISIREINFELYLRSPSGSLVIGNAGHDEDSAHGTLYPTVDMLDVDLLLLDGSNSLRDSLVLEMEGANISAASIDRVRQSQANLGIDWDEELRSYRTFVLKAAYQRYFEWHESYRVGDSEWEAEDSEEHTSGSA